MILLSEFEAIELHKITDANKSGLVSINLSAIILKRQDNQPCNFENNESTLSNDLFQNLPLTYLCIV